MLLFFNNLNKSFIWNSFSIIALCLSIQWCRKRHWQITHTSPGLSNRFMKSRSSICLRLVYVKRVSVEWNYFHFNKHLSILWIKRSEERLTFNKQESRFKDVSKSGKQEHEFLFKIKINAIKEMVFLQRVMLNLWSPFKFNFIISNILNLVYSLTIFLNKIALISVD